MLPNSSHKHDFSSRGDKEKNSRCVGWFVKFEMVSEVIKGSQQGVWRSMIYKRPLALSS